MRSMLALAAFALAFGGLTNIANADSPISAEGMQKISAAESVSLFKALCLDKQPDFKGAAKTAKQLGFTQSRGDGELVNPETGALFASYQIRGASLCELIFRSSSSDTAISNELKKIEVLKYTGRLGSFTYNKNGQKPVSAGKVNATGSSKVRMIRMFVSPTAAQYD